MIQIELTDKEMSVLLCMCYMKEQEYGFTVGEAALVKSLEDTKQPSPSAHVEEGPVS